jgi:hypothetical protein
MADEKQQAPPVTGPLDYSTNAPSILAIVGFFDAFALLVVLARIYVRGVMLKTVGTDDYVMMAAMVNLTSNLFVVWKLNWLYSSSVVLVCWYASLEKHIMELECMKIPFWWRIRLQSCIGISSNRW